MRSIIIYIAVFILLLFIILFFIIRGALKRTKQSKQNNIDSLKPGNAVHEFKLDIQFTHEVKLKIESFLKDKKFRIIEGVEKGIIAYSGKTENATLKGWINIDPMQFPIRLICKPGPNGQVIISMDDDYGFQVLNSIQKQKFQALNNKKFKFYEEEIINLLSKS